MQRPWLSVAGTILLVSCADLIGADFGRTRAKADGAGSGGMLDVESVGGAGGMRSVSTNGPVSGESFGGASTNAGAMNGGSHAAETSCDGPEAEGNGASGNDNGAGGNDNGTGGNHNGAGGNHNGTGGNDNGAGGNHNGAGGNHNGAGGNHNGAGGDDGSGGATGGDIGGRSGGFGGVVSGGVSGAGGEDACGQPTPQLDPDQDGLNDACDDDDDDDGVRDTADAARRDPRVPRRDPPSTMPGVILSDACVQAALKGADEALAAAGLAPKFPLALEHTPPALSTFYVRPWSEEDGGGTFIAGPDATPGAPLEGSEFKLLPRANSRLTYSELEFDAEGVAAWTFIQSVELRGRSNALTLLFRESVRVRLIAGRFLDGDLYDIAELIVHVGIREYPNASCPENLGRWSLSWAPIWRAADVRELTYMCIDDGAAYHPHETWTRAATSEDCSCDTSPGVGVRSVVSCVPL